MKKFIRLAVFAGALVTMVACTSKEEAKPEESKSAVSSVETTTVKGDVVESVVLEAK